MELVVTLTDKDNLLKYSDYDINGIIIGSIFSSRFNYSLEDLKKTVFKAKLLGIKVYVSIDAFINEDDIQNLYYYFEELRELEVDGIYFHDLAVVEVAKSYQMESILIYDGGPMVTNSLDIGSYLAMGIDSVVIARELTIDEILVIIKNQSQKVDMQIFGYQRMSTSKRMFLSNYFKQINKNYNPKDVDTLKIIEEKRDYKLPIKENKYGTSIYTDYVLETIEELPYLSKMIKRGIVDDQFLSIDVVCDILSALQRVDEKNAYFVKNAFMSKHKDLTFSTGYFYSKTNIVKEDE